MIILWFSDKQTIRDSEIAYAARVFDQRPNGARVQLQEKHKCDLYKVSYDIYTT